MFSRKEARRRLVLGGSFGVLWYGVLLIPPWTRDVLASREWFLRWQMMLLMVVVSAVLSALLPVARAARSRVGFAVVGLTLPLVGACAFSFALLVTALVPSFLEEDVGAVLGGLFPVLCFVVVPGTLVGGVVACAAASYVAIPFGYLHTLALARFAGGRLFGESPR